MMPDQRIDLLGRVGRLRFVQREVGSVVQERSVLALSAASYGAKPDPNETSPTGFDPRAVALFEAIVEGAFLVATCDDSFDDAERDVFLRIVTAASGGAVSPRAVADLVVDLADMLTEDGLDKRIDAVMANTPKREHAEEVLRVGALIAHASEGIGHAERQILERLAAAAGMSSRDVDSIIGDVQRALAGASVA